MSDRNENSKDKQLLAQEKNYREHGPYDFKNITLAADRREASRAAARLEEKKAQEKNYPKNGGKQRGGSSDFMGLFYANTAVGGPAAISQATLQGINNAPMFNPLSTNSAVPGNSTGIVPTGTYLATHTGGGSRRQRGSSRRQRGSSCCAGGSANQRGASVADLRTECNNRGLSCRGPNGKYLPKAKLVKLLEQHGGAFNGLYAMAPPSNQPTFHPTK